MKKILTIFLSLLLVLVVAYGAASYWIGGQAIKQHDQLISQINLSNVLQASTKSYERGLFKSTVLTTFTLTRPENTGLFEFGIVSSIYHGPFVFLENSHLKWGLRPVLAVIRSRLAPNDSAEVLKKALESVPELKSSEALTVLYFDGSGQSYLEVPPFQRQLPADEAGQAEVQWGGFTAESKLDGALGKVTASYSLPSMQVTQKDSHVSIMDLKGDLNSQPGIKGIHVGSASLSVADIEGSGQDNTPFSMKSFEIKAESGVSGETVGMSMRLNLEKVNAGGMGLGPFALEFEARKLDAEVLSRFQKLAPQIQKKVAEHTEGAKEEMEKLVSGLMADLLAKSPEFEIKQLNVKTDKGDLSGRAKLTFNGPGLHLGANILALLASIDASAELSVSEPLFLLIAENALRDGSAPQSEEAAKASATGIVDGLIAANIMVRSDDSFQSNATYKHGVVTINGRKLDLSKLK